MRDNIDDEAVSRAESKLSLESITEILWGGRHGQGLTYTVAQIANTVSKLDAAVDKLLSEINGVDGVRADIRVIQKRCDTFEAELDISKRLVWRIFSVLALIGILTILADGKVAYEFFTEHMK